MDVYVLSSINSSKGEVPKMIGKNFAEAIQGLCCLTHPIFHFNRYIFKIKNEMFMVRKISIEETTRVVIISKRNKDDGSESIFGLASSEQNAFKFIKKFINVSNVNTSDDGMRIVVGNVVDLSTTDNDTIDEYYIRSFKMRRV